ncbi:MAG TPA: ArsI/CadI family heavy metal resistance metalloenzyme [Gammaproteobacteria bacterium]|nr:ArsI/CadI family heavy metal resistance metalloenzyme [Gammaproteobacteria bacterium]
MARFHVHVTVKDLQTNIDFYSTVFGTAPTVVKDDYAKWMLEDPKVNFAISTRGRDPGLDHVGIQTESDSELAAIEGRLSAAGIAGEAQTGTACCYARSDKYWTVDPQGIPWETFHTLGSVPTFNEEEADGAEAGACCAPKLNGCC